MDYDEEEILVYTDFQQSILSVDELEDPNMNIKIIGIETEHPLIIINSKIFKGTYEYTCGTNVFFADDTENTEQRPQDPIFDKQIYPFYKYVDKTNKTLKMKRIFVNPINKNDKTDEPPETEEMGNSRLEVTKTYDEALNQFLKPGEERPRVLAETSTNFVKTKVSSEDTAADDEDDKAKDGDYVPYDLDVG